MEKVVKSEIRKKEKERRNHEEGVKEEMSRRGARVKT